MLNTFLTSLLFATYLMLIGCGTTGPLYIPEQRYPLPPENETQKAPAESTTAIPDNQPTKE